jgi:hypothetical protein|tara:strand:+ start:960 stop:1409 length:450 start_codon:yes stop_codon:yes gene_type:complete
MALQGNIRFYKYEATGETEIITVDIPEDIPAEHPQYENRGKTVEMEQPIIEKIIDEDKSFDNAYTIISSCGFTQHNHSKDDKIWYLSIMYKVFESKEAKDNGDLQLQLNDWTPMVNIDLESEEFTSKTIVEFAYDELKKTEAFSECVDV